MPKELSEMTRPELLNKSLELQNKLRNDIAEHASATKDKRQLDVKLFEKESFQDEGDIERVNVELARRS
ncbi:MAG: hypothetical protein EXR67_00875 [Dehalococcoidia bacterium]|nr:hypothetical protein [Dehalococcoidia bacterium]